MPENSAVFYLLVVFVGLAAIAFAAQAVALIMIARSTRDLREQLQQLRPKAADILDQAGDTVTETRKQLTAITAKANQILDTTTTQVKQTDAFLTDATVRARAQLDRVELVLDDSITRVHETVMILNDGVLRPVRQVSGVVAGVRAALEFFGRGQRPNVSQATTDEEMFI